MKTPHLPAAPAPLVATPASHAQPQADQRPATRQQQQLGAAIEASPRQVAQRQQAAATAPPPNATGLPDQLRAGIEHLSGHSLADVRVHYNSARPAQLKAHAYAQGTDIHLAPSQEKHLPHEAWHVVQQKQGRVRPTMQLKGVALNDARPLEQEADRMGARATAWTGKAVQRKVVAASAHLVQRVAYPEVEKLKPKYSRLFLDIANNTLHAREVARYLEKARALPGYEEASNLQKAVAAMTVGQFQAFADSLTAPATASAQGASQKGAPKQPGTSTLKFPTISSPVSKPTVSAPVPQTSQSVTASATAKKPKGLLPQLGASTTAAKDPAKKLVPTSTTTRPPGQTATATRTKDSKPTKGKEERSTEPLGALPWTHNTGTQGLVGLLGGGQFLTTVEDNVNFRYDLDSRYHQGVSLVMKPGLERRHDGIVHDLYKQSTRVSGVPFNPASKATKSRNSVNSVASDATDNVGKHLARMAEESDFRDTQLARIGDGKKLKANNPDNYKLSVANPQLRLPVLGNISSDEIDFVIVTNEVSALLDKLVAGKTAEKEITKLLEDVEAFIKAQAKKKGDSKLAFRVRAAVNRLIALQKAGKLLVVGKSGYSHNTGRVTGAKVSDTVKEEKMRAAASQGMEYGAPYFEAETNNSPAALDLETFVAFQEKYYEQLAKDPRHRAQAIAADRLAKRSGQRTIGQPNPGKEEEDQQAEKHLPGTQGQLPHSGGPETMTSPEQATAASREKQQADLAAATGEAEEKEPPADFYKQVEARYGTIESISGQGMNCYIRSLVTASGVKDIEGMVDAIAEHLEHSELRTRAQMIDAGGKVAKAVQLALAKLLDFEPQVWIVMWDESKQKITKFQANNGKNPVQLLYTPGHFSLLHGA